jgi:hypothetical protein
VFGSADLFRLARTIVSVMDQAGTAACAVVGLQEGVPRGWLDSPYGYEKAMDAAVRMLDLLKPPGVFEAGRTLPLKSRSRAAQDEEIRQLMEAVLDATRRLPFLRERLEDRELKELRDRLGRLADRIKEEEESE